MGLTIDHMLCAYVTAANALVAVAGVPMALRRVPPNGVYGFRVPETLNSPAVWYQVNAWAGWTLIVIGTASALMCPAVFWFTGNATTAVIVAGIALTVPLFVSTFVLWAAAGRRARAE